MLDPGRYGGAARVDNFTLDEAFLYAEDNIHHQKEEPAYLKQAKSLEKQLATEDTLIESLLRLLILMSESESHQVSSTQSLEPSQR